MDAVSKSVEEEEEHVSKPLATTNAKEDNDMDYGSVSSTGSRKAEHAFLKTISQWGGPHTLLLWAWVSLIPIVLPLLWIGLSNLTNDFFVHSCHRYDMFTFKRIVCDISTPCVYFFPCLSIFAAFGLLTWRLVQHRVFYVLLRHRIFLEMSTKPQFTKWLMPGLTLMFALALVHLSMIVLLGTQLCQDDAFDKTACDSTAPLLPTSVGYVIQHPNVLVLDPEYHQLFVFLRVATQQFLVPGVLALFFILQLGDTEATLIPISILVETGPAYVTNHFAESICVPEHVARDILENLAQDAGGAAELSNHDISEACESFRKEALSFQGVVRMGGQADVECVPLSVLNQAPLDHITLWGLMSKRWWQMSLILKDDNSESQEPIQFRTAWCIHCMLSLVLIGLCLGGRVAGVNAVIQGHLYDGYTTVVYCICATPPMAMFSSTICILVRSIWFSWR